MENQLIINNSNLEQFDFSKLDTVEERRILLWEISKYIIILRRYSWGRPYPIHNVISDFPSHIIYTIDDLPTYIKNLITNNLLEQADIIVCYSTILHSELKPLVSKYSLKKNQNKKDIISDLVNLNIPEEELLNCSSFKWLYEATDLAKEFMDSFAPLTEIIYSHYQDIDWYIELCADAGYLVDLKNAKKNNYDSLGSTHTTIDYDDNK